MFFIYIALIIENSLTVFPNQQVHHFGIVSFGRGHADSVDKATLGVDTDMSIHVEMPALPFFRSTDVRITLRSLFLVDDEAWMIVASTIQPPADNCP